MGWRAQPKVLLSRRFFSEPAARGAINVGLRDYFPYAFGQFLGRNLSQRGRSFQPKLAEKCGMFQHSMTSILPGFLASLLVLTGVEWAARGHRIGASAEVDQHA